MKTIIFQKAGEVLAEVNADIFATQEQLASEGFDTQFTNMTIKARPTTETNDPIDKVDDEFIVEGFDVTEIPNNWQGAIKLAKDLDVSMFVLDMNADVDSLIEIVTES